MTKDGTLPDAWISTFRDNLTALQMLSEQFPPEGAKFELRPV